MRQLLNQTIDGLKTLANKPGTCMSSKYLFVWIVFGRQAYTEIKEFCVQNKVKKIVPRWSSAHSTFDFQEEVKQYANGEQHLNCAADEGLYHCPERNMVQVGGGQTSDQQVEGRGVQPNTSIRWF